MASADFEDARHREPDGRSGLRRGHERGGSQVLLRIPVSGGRRITARRPVTGRKIEIRAVQIIGLTPGGKTRTVRHYLDMATMLAQLGIAAAGV